MSERALDERGHLLYLRPDGLWEHLADREYPLCPLNPVPDMALRTLPGHPVNDGAGYDCCCGGCLSLPARKDGGDE
jgi:hypothetical protein